LELSSYLKKAGSTRREQSEIIYGPKSKKKKNHSCHLLPEKLLSCQNRDYNHPGLAVLQSMPICHDDEWIKNRTTLVDLTGT
jgi:hypothetical protein